MTRHMNGRENMSEEFKNNISFSDKDTPEQRS